MQTAGDAHAAFEDKLLDLSRGIDDFEGYAHAHALRIAEIADALAASFGLPTDERRALQHAALIHDIGELAMNRDYIKASRRLAGDELMDLQRHTVIGEQEASRRGFAKDVQLLIRWHHEWWNGEGYPDRLAREEIPLPARILRLADSYSALTDDRPRREKRSVEDAIQYVMESAAIEFDPRVVRAFLDVVAERRI